MTELGARRGRRAANLRGGELPSYVRPRRQRFSLGVTAVLLTGLAAVGLTGFVSVATLFEREAVAAEHASSREPVPDSGAGGETGGEQEYASADMLVANPLYNTGELPTTECPAPELEPADSDSMERFLHSVTDCLDESWETQFQEADLPFERPVRVYWSTQGLSPCGQYPTQETAAFYCRQNKGLYLGVTDVLEKSDHIDHPEAYSRLLSHEYGHHVQEEAGILPYFHVARAESGSGEEQDAWTRRSELQADCLAGAFLGSIRESFPIAEQGRANILEDAHARADGGLEQGRTHGTPENAVLWTEHGFDRRDPAACNTWDARVDLVE